MNSALWVANTGLDAQQTRVGFAAHLTPFLPPIMLNSCYVLLNWHF